jgi:hypothetical protein
MRTPSNSRRDSASDADPGEFSAGGDLAVTAPAEASPRRLP